MRKLSVFFIAICLLFLTACSETTSNKSIKPILNVEQFSLVNQAFVKEKIGEPKSIDTWNYESPSMVKHVLTALEYDWIGYYSEFHFDDKDRLIRINIYPSDNKESQFEKTSFENYLKQLGITPGENITKVADTGAAWRYQKVSEKVDEVWSLYDGNNIETIKISFDVRPFL
ncbi:hypothetical protein [Cytobacillus massiliigabonensis]|uniref:hypothetical protein n=1 Tax=Cytobacillus massiliigabonensis TaxID=1871011 RepID=UPI000C8206A4|nr:hypothetical protein [Cytobacillus massiliigabonensis]